MALYYFFEWYNARAARRSNVLEADIESDYTYALGEMDQAPADADSSQTDVSDGRRLPAKVLAEDQPKFIGGKVSDTT